MSLYTIEFNLCLMKFISMNLESFINFPIIKYLNLVQNHFPNNENKINIYIKFNSLLKNLLNSKNKELNFLPVYKKTK